MIEATELNRILLSRMEDVCLHLFPKGKRVGPHWLVGGIDGEPGESLKITVSGGSVGRFLDFANQDTKGATPLWLWSKAKNKTFSDAVEDAALWAGIKETDYGVRKFRQKVYSRPGKAEIRLVEPNTKVMDYLTTERRLNPIVLANAKICEDENGESAVFPFIEHDPETNKLVCVHRKYLRINRPDGKKDVWSTKGTKRCLFGKNLVSDDTREIVITEGECYSGDTQVLTKSGWVRFDRLVPGEEVLQVHEDGSGDFVRPIANIQKPFSGDLIRFASAQIDFLVTPNHNMVCFGKGGENKKIAASSIGRQMLLHKTASVSGAGILLSDDQIKFCIAVSADAKIDTRKGGGWRGPREMRYVHFGLKKQRKKDRLEALLKSNNLNCRITHGVGADGLYSYYSMSIPDWVCGRKLPWSWISCATGRQRRLILDELIEWDGNRVVNRRQTEYSSKFEYNAEWVQSMASTSGIASTIMERSNQLGEWLKVSILNGKSTACISERFKSYVPYDGIVYCVTVPSGAILTRRNRKIAVCGNCDALSWHSLGIEAASIPNGVTDFEWIDLDWDWLARFEKIYVSMDMDDPGKQAAQEICKRLGLHRCLIVSLPKKDANDYLVAGATREDMLRCLASARAIELDEIKKPDDFRKDVIDHYINDPATFGLETPWFPVLPWRIRPGEFTVLSGFSGSGKTLGMNQLMIHALQAGLKVMDASLEIRPGMTLYYMTRCAMAKRQLTGEEADACVSWINNNMFFLDCMGTVNVDRIMHAMTYARKRHGVDVFVIDSLFKCGLAPEDYAAARDFADKLTSFCINTGSSVILVAHSRKTQNGNELHPPSKADVAGSSDITNAAFNVIIFWRNKAKKRKVDECRQSNNLEELAHWIDQPDGKIVLDKQRFGEGEEAEVAVWYDPESCQFHTNPNKRTPYFQVE